MSDDDTPVAWGDLPIVRCDPRIPPGRVYLAPIGSDPADPTAGWELLGTADRIEFVGIPEFRPEERIRLDVPRPVEFEFTTRLTPAELAAVFGYSWPLPWERHPAPLIGLDGHEYHRRQRARARRRSRRG